MKRIVFLGDSITHSGQSWTIGLGRMPMRALAFTDPHFSVEQTLPGLQTVSVAEKTDCIDILKALADRTRLRLIKALLENRASVNELTEELGLSQYNTSKHLRVLKQAGIVDLEPVGARREYFIAPEFRRRLQREGPVLDFGCCTFRFDQLPG